MGLHDSLLNVPERLRVWQMAGVQHFYLSDKPLEAPPEAVAPDDAQSTQVRAVETAPDVEPASPPVVAPQPWDILTDPATWPDPWPGFLAKAPAAPLLLITYLELGFDLTGRADPRRGPLWRRLIAALGLAGRNAVAFWPLALPDGASSEPCPKLFVSGCHVLAPRRIAVFGQDAWDSLDAAARDRLPAPVVVLPDPAVLVAGDKEAFAHAVATLSQP